MIYCILSSIMTLRGTLVKCPYCRGNGSIRDVDRCIRCHGSGTEELVRRERVQAACGVCGGSGRGLGSYDTPCVSCGGRGTKEETIEHREYFRCSSCHGEPVTTWFTECQVCDGSGRITAELRGRLRKRRLIRALVKSAVFLLLIFAALCALVYFTQRL